MAAARVGYRNLAAAKRILFPVASVTSKTYHRCICVGFAANVNEKVTHTGQIFDDSDWKRVRFTDREKLVNVNVAEQLIDEIPPTMVDQRVISCDGGGGALGHPKVFINLDKPGAHACGYCGLRFEKKAHH